MSNQIAWNAFAYFSAVLGPLSVMSSIVCGLAVTSNYCFAKQRKFPNIVLIWVCGIDTLISVYMAMRWVDGPLKRVLADQITPGSYACRVTLYFDLVLQMASSAGCVVLAFTLHATIVRNVDFENFSAKYHYRFIAAIWLFSLLFPLLLFVQKDADTQGIGYCTLTTTLGTVLMVVPYFIFLAVQLGLIIPVFIYISRLKNKIQPHCTKTGTYTRGQLWLYARFIGVLCNQIVFWFTVLLYDMFNIYKHPVAIAHYKTIGITPIFLALNGIIILAGNKSLKKWIADRYKLQMSCLAKTMRKKEAVESGDTQTKDCVVVLPSSVVAVDFELTYINTP